MHATPTDIARKALADHLAALPAAELLSRYAARRDPEAFAGLVQQFGPMVLGVCHRVLGRSADVDDAFQAVFLSLARQADSFRDAAALPAWLHRVALRVAHKALARRAGASAPPETVPDPTDPFAEVAWKDVRRTLDEELDALPDKYRGPVVLCWLDGLTQDEAARRLGTSLATLKRRLDAAGELLRARLVRRGLAPVLAAGAVLDATGLTASVPDALSIAAITLGFQASEAPSGVGALETFVAVAEPGRRYLRAVAALALAAGVAVVALSPEPPTPPNEPAPKLPDSPRTVELAPEPRPVAAKLPPRLVPRNRMTGYVRGPDLWWSPNGKLLAAITTDVTGENERVTLWDVETFAVRTTLGTGAKARGIGSLAFDPSGTTIAVGHSDGTIRFWNVATGKETDALRDLGGPVSALAWSADGALLAFHTGNALTVWDVRAKKPRSTPTINEEKVTALAFSPDGTALAALAFSPDTTTDNAKNNKEKKDWSKLHVALVVFEVGTARPRARHEFAPTVDGYVYSEYPSGFLAKFRALVWSTDGRIVTAACPSADSLELVSLDAVTGKVHERRRTADANSELNFSGLTHISPDGQLLTRGVQKRLGSDQRVTFKLLDARTGKKRATLADGEGLVRAARFSPDGKTLACLFRGHRPTGWGFELDDRAEIRLIDVEAGTNRYATFAIPATDEENAQPYFKGAGWMPNGPVGVLARANESLLWSPVTGEQTALAFKPGSKDVWNYCVTSPDGRYAALPSKTATSPGDAYDIDIWDITANRLRTTLKGHEKANRPPKWSRDGRVLASFEEGVVVVWDVETGKLRAKLPASVEDPTAWDISPDGKTVIAGPPFVPKPPEKSGDEGPTKVPNVTGVTAVTLWDVETGKHRRIPIDAVALSLSHDGKYIAYTDEKGTRSAEMGFVRVWDVAAGREYAKLDAPGRWHNWGGPVLAFSPDGSTLAYVSRIESGKEVNHAIQLWDVATKRAREPLTGHYDVRFLAWKPDGTTLASFNLYEMMLWDVSAAQKK